MPTLLAGLIGADATDVMVASPAPGRPAADAFEPALPAVAAEACAAAEAEPVDDASAAADAAVASEAVIAFA
jgi:hypothetical protein